MNKRMGGTADIYVDRLALNCNHTWFGMGWIERLSFKNQDCV